MAVVVNEMEVAPESGQAQPPSPAGAAPRALDSVKQVEKTLLKKQQRTTRLEAY